MGISTGGIVLFIHIGSVVVAMMLSAVLHTMLLMSRRARVTAEYRPWLPVIAVVEPLLPVTTLLIIGSGVWLLHLSGGQFNWGDGWVITALVLLAVIEAGGAVAAPRSKAFQAMVRKAPDGPVPAEVRKAGADPAFWYTSHGATGAMLGIIFLMSTKPAAGWCVAVAVIAVLVGVASAVPFVRGPAAVTVPDQRVETGTVGEPAGIGGS